MKLHTYPKSGSPYRVLLKENPEGVYVFVFDSRESQYPEKDWLQDDWEMAKRACFQDFGIQDHEWIPTTSSNP